MKMCRFNAKDVIELQIEYRLYNTRNVGDKVFFAQIILEIRAINLINKLPF